MEEINSFLSKSPIHADFDKFYLSPPWVDTNNVL